MVYDVIPSHCGGIFLLQHKPSVIGGLLSTCIIRLMIRMSFFHRHFIKFNFCHEYLFRDVHALIKQLISSSNILANCSFDQIIRVADIHNLK
jgi:hypothetical protein